MKKTEFAKTKEQSLIQLRSQLVKLEKELIDLRFKLHFGKLKDVHLPTKKRREIAIVKTLISEKALIGGTQ